jgi:hypothetical protein
MAVLERMIVALEAYLNVSSSAGSSEDSSWSPSQVGRIVEAVMAEDEAAPGPTDETDVTTETTDPGPAAPSA